MASPPLDTLLRSLPRPVLNRPVERAIDYMDEIDGDADFELSGDGYWFAEDEFCDHPRGCDGGAGCPVSDPTEDTNDAENVIWSTLRI